MQAVSLQPSSLHGAKLPHMFNAFCLVSLRIGWAILVVPAEYLPTELRLAGQRGLPTIRGACTWLTEGATSLCTAVGPGGIGDEETAGEEGRPSCTEGVETAAAATWAYDEETAGEDEETADEEGRPGCTEGVKTAAAATGASSIAKTSKRLPFLPFTVIGQSANVACRGAGRAVFLALWKPSSSTMPTTCPKNGMGPSSMALTALPFFLSGQPLEACPSF